MKHNKNTFEYLGRHFTPVKRLTNKQLELNNLVNHQYRDFELGFTTYEDRKQNYSHEGFYNVCGEMYYDLFRCEENGKIYIPCQNELFEYV